MQQRLILLLVLVASAAVVAAPLETSFTYQGELQAAGQPANGQYDFEFELFDDLSMGSLRAGPVVVEDVAVVNGVFSVELDFGAGPFAGDQLWLEIGVREAASASGYTALIPRQKLTAAPYAMHAEMVAANSIAGTEIANNSVTAADIAAGAVGSSELINGSVSAADIDSTAVQRRVTGSCVAGTSITEVDEDGSVQCASPGVRYENFIVVAKSGGDFTRVTDAMNAIGTDPQYPTPSDVNRYLVWVAPGVYNGEDVDMQPFVDIQGSGQGVTVLHSEGGTGGISPDSATLVGADDAELRDITVEIDAAGAGLWSHAIYTNGTTRFRNVTANARGGAHPRGMMVHAGGSPRLNDVTVEASGGSTANLGLDVFGSTLIADGLTANADGGNEAKAIFVNTASSDVVFNNVSVLATGASVGSYGFHSWQSSMALTNFRVTVDSAASGNFGVRCEHPGRLMRFTNGVVLVNSTAAGAGGEVRGVQGISCDLDVRNVVIDANATTDNRVFGFEHFNIDPSDPGDVNASNIEVRTRSAGSSSSAIRLWSAGGAAVTVGRIDNAKLQSTGGSISLNSMGIWHSAPGEVQYRGATIVAEGDANFLYGIRADGGAPRFDDMVITAVGNAATTVFGIELLTDFSSANNARVTAINVGSGDGHDAVGIKSNSAGDVAFTDITAYAEAETNVWGAHIAGGNSRLVRVDARAVGNPGNLVYGAACSSGSVSIRDSLFRSASGTTSSGFRSFECTSTIHGSELVGDTYGANTFANVSAVDTTTIRQSYLEGGLASITTGGVAEALVVHSSLSGPSGTSISATDIQECTAVTYNSGGSEMFEAGTVDPCP